MKPKYKNQSLRGGDWFGCGRKITTESWNGFLAARKAYYAEQDKKVEPGVLDVKTQKHSVQFAPGRAGSTIPRGLDGVETT